jgi:hypothetical protein
VISRGDSFYQVDNSVVQQATAGIHFGQTFLKEADDMNFSLNEFIRAVLLILVSICSITLSAPAKVFILSGQSNMCGYGLSSDIMKDDFFSMYRNGFPVKLYKAFDNGPLYTYSKLTSDISGYINKEGFSGLNTFGPELSIAAKLLAAYPNDKIIFIKIAWAGTGLKSCWLNDSNGVYTWFIARLATALDLIKTDPAGFILSGFFWTQGESDALDKTTAANYSSNLQYFVNSKIRSFLWNRYPQNMSSLNLPFVYSRIRNQSSYCWKYGTIVQHEQYVVQKLLTCSRCSDSSTIASFWVYPNTIPGSNFAPPHYNSRGAISVGNGLGNEMINLLAGKKGLGCNDPMDPQSASDFLLKVGD